MSYLMWLVVLSMVAAYAVYVGDTTLKIRADLATLKAQLSTVLSRLPVPDRSSDLSSGTVFSADNVSTVVVDQTYDESPVQTDEQIVKNVITSR